MKTLALWYVKNTWNKLGEVGKILVVAGIVVLVMLPFTHHKNDTDSLRQADSVIASANKVLKENDSLLKKVAERDTAIAKKDSSIARLKVYQNELNSAAAIQRRSIAQQKAVIDSLKGKKDSATLVVTVAKQDTLIHSLDSLVKNRDSSLTIQTSINSTQASQIVNLKINEEDLKADVARLSGQVVQDTVTIKNLENTIKKKDKVLGFIPLPSRKAVAAGTAVVTTIFLSIIGR